MTTQPKMTSQDEAAHREHVAWLAECGRWRSGHRQTLAMLAKVQAAVMEQEAARIVELAERGDGPHEGAGVAIDLDDAIRTHVHHEEVSGGRAGLAYEDPREQQQARDT